MAVRGAAMTAARSVRVERTRNMGRHGVRRCVAPVLTSHCASPECGMSPDSLPIWTLLCTSDSSLTVVISGRSRPFPVVYVARRAYHDQQAGPTVIRGVRFPPAHASTQRDEHRS